jgi:adenylate kinase
MGEIHFIGGIHGVGKGTICNKVRVQTTLVHLTASKLLKWNEISAMDNKKVENIQNTQDRIIAGLNNATKANESYLLDGHYCLFNADGEVEKVPLETFLKIAPKSITVVVDKVELIKQRLEKRDKKTYDFDVLSTMQNTEKEYAKEIAAHLDIPFIGLKNGDSQPLIDVIK